MFLPFAGCALLALLMFRFPALGIACAVVLAIAGAAVWYLGARKRRAQLHRWRAISNMQDLSPEAFEQHVADTYERLGYKVTVTPIVGDQGIDVIAERGF
jgi:HJR/Mrr/RecB family endonuclease